MVAVPIPIEDPALTQEVLPSSTAGTYLTRVAAALEAQVRVLPVTADDLQRDFGYEFYSRVALDPHVAAFERILITAALNQGIQYGIPVPRTDPQYAQAAKYQAFVQQAFTRLPRSLESILYEMGTAARQHGHKLAEAVWAPAKILPNYSPHLIYADLKPKPLAAYAFVQDTFANTLGIVPRLLPVPAGVRGVLVNGTLGGQPVYPLSKFPVLTWDERNRDPRGNSALRTIYGAWYKKRQTEPGLLAYLARFGQPSLKVTLPPGAPDKVVVAGVEYATTDYYRLQAEAYQAGGVYVQPHGADAALEEAKGDGSAYINAEILWNREISVGLTGQSLATGEGQHRSGTDATTHQDVLGLIVTYIKGWLGDWTTRTLIAPLIRVNFGEAAVPLAPTADLGRISPEDLAALLQAFAQLAGPGNYWNPAVVPSDIGAKLDQRVGLPERQTTQIGPTGQPADTPAPAPVPGPAAPPAPGAPA